MEQIDWSVVQYHALWLAIAYVLTLPITWNRERIARSAGLRTFPLIAIASCGLTLIATQVLQEHSAQARLVEGTITAIGFLGGGAILRSGAGISGTATAASIWITGAIGIAVAFQRLEIALLLSAMIWLTLHLPSPAKTTGGASDQDEV